MAEKEDGTFSIAKFCFDFLVTGSKDVRGLSQSLLEKLLEADTSLELLPVRDNPDNVEATITDPSKIPQDRQEWRKYFQV